MSFIQSLIPSLSRTPAAATETSTGASVPAVRPVYAVTETPEAWGLTVELPGVAKAGLTITDEDGVLRIRGERTWKQPSEWTLLYRESVERPFELALEHDGAVDADKIVAQLNDGVLRVSLPKAEARKPRKIAVS